MNKSILLSALLAMALVACKSTPMKEAAVEDKSASKPAATAPAPAADTSASTQGAGDSTPAGAINPLKDPNNILSKRNVYFDFDKDEVKAEFRPLIEAHAKYLLANPSANLVLQGNTDDTGTREYNVSLGQRRAVAVKKVMNLLGVQDKQIETVSYGEEKANTACADDACKKQDRRVDIVYQGE